MDNNNNNNDNDNHEILDIQLITICNREELFELIKTNPKYYLALIKKHKLEDQLMIKINKDDNNYTIKFKINADDRWIEVGYFNDISITENDVVNDFIRQVDYQLTINNGINNDMAHLSSQLNQNTDDLKEYAGYNFDTTDRLLQTKQDIIAHKLMNNFQNRSNDVNSNDENMLNGGEDVRDGDNQMPMQHPNKKRPAESEAESLQRKLITGYNMAILGKLKKYIKINSGLNQITIVPPSFNVLHTDLIDHFGNFSYMFKILSMFNDNYHNDHVMKNIHVHFTLRNKYPFLYDGLNSDVILNEKDKALIVEKQLELRDL